MQRKLAVLGLAGLFLVMSLVVAGDSIAPNNPSAIVIASGTCVIRVQYLDGCPRSNADVFVRSPPSYIGRTNESGQVECSLANGGYQIFALYPPGGPQFGTDVFLPVPEGTTMTANYEITPPNITILSPQNLTYTNSSVPLTYTIDDFSAISWIGYSLDGQANMTIAENITLTSIPVGSHNTSVYSNDTYGNMGRSQTVYFTRASDVVIRVQYADGFPRSGAVVWNYQPELIPIGVTDNNGLVSCSYLNDGTYWFRAYWPPPTPQFGDDTPLVVDHGHGSAIITYSNGYEITPPAIAILSPQNQTYTNRTVPLTYAIYDFSPISWTGYSLDGQANMTITGNTTLAGLSFGSHNVSVYSNDTYGNMGSSETVYFTVQRTGIVTVKVQYLDGAPRSGADVFVKTPLSYLGRTDSNGDAINDWLSPGACTIFALYPPGGPQFGSDAGLIVDDTGYGSATITANYEMTPPIITILSPQNITYANGSVPLTFSVYDYSSVPWMGYSLDGQSNITIAGNTTLTVGEGTHSVVVYANDTFGNMDSSETVYFSFSRHDIAVTSVSTCKDSCVPMSTVSRGFTVHVNATVLNLGEYVETFDVTVCANDTVVGTQTVHDLNPGNQTVLSFLWNSSGYSIGNYTISAYAMPVLGEVEISNNNCTGGTVKVTIVGDVNGDDKVDMKDIGTIARAFMTYPGVPFWNPNGDLIDDHKIDMKDIGTIAKHFGEHYP